MMAIVQVPDFGDRFYVYQIVDARTDSFCSIGKQYQPIARSSSP